MTTEDERRKRLGGHIRADRALRIGSKATAVLMLGASRPTWDRLEAGNPVEDYTYFRAEQVLGYPRGSIVDYLEGNGPLPEVMPAAVEEVEEFVADATEVVEQSMTEDEILARVQLARRDLNSALDDLARLRGEGP